MSTNDPYAPPSATQVTAGIPLAAMPIEAEATLAASQTVQHAGAPWPVPVLESPAPGWRHMIDSINPDAIADALEAGEQADLIAGYPDFGWLHADFENFRDAGLKVVEITQAAPADWRQCSVGDGEFGALTWAEVRQFIIKRNGFRPGTATGYASFNNLPNLGKACTGLEYWVWVAWWPAYPTLAEVEQIRAALAPGARLAAIQYRSLPRRDIDLSVVLDSAWHR